MPLLGLGCLQASGGPGGMPYSPGLIFWPSADAELDRENADRQTQAHHHDMRTSVVFFELDRSPTAGRWLRQEVRDVDAATLDRTRDLNRN
jgi:hypothetical protein